jgi:hypothetical protein
MSFAALFWISLVPSFAASPPAAGETAPDFTLKDSNGRTYRLSDLKGKYVVLEWVNFGCPFVRKHYSSGNMPSLQKFYTAKNVIWLSICSSAPGKQGYFEGEELKAEITKMKAVPSAYLVDPDGTVGRLYAAKTTPTMFVIDPRGTIIYGGAIDDIPSTNPDDVQKARNYVKEALDLAMDGKSVQVTTSKSYGCSVKYKD